jgi:hypothetical protein
MIGDKKMKTANHHRRFYIFIMLPILVLIPSWIKSASADGPAPAQDVTELAAQVDTLNRKVEELSRLVEILMSHAAPVSNLPGNAATGANAESLTSSSVSKTQERPAEQAQRDPSLLRVSGDFRLRLDGIFRPASDSSNSDQQSLVHVQNVRGRYRLRLNFDSQIHPMVSFHGQLTTGPLNNPLTLDQDFAGVTARHPIAINEAWVSFHPRDWVSFQGGKVPEVFADNLRFLFDDDIAFNGFNQRLTHNLSKPVGGIRRIEFRSGQYIFTNPNIASVTPENLGPTGAIIGSTARSAQLFHQGFLVEQNLFSKASQVIGADIQFYRNPNQIQFASTAAGVPVLVQNALGIALSGPLTGTGNATTTPGGAMYSAPNFQVARLTYRFDYDGFKSARQEYPITVNFQVARNVGIGGPERDALLANIKIGKIKKFGDYSFLYMFAMKGANSMISQLTDDDLGTSSGVNIRSHYFRFDLGLAKKIQLQNLFYIQNELANSGEFPQFFVPLNAYTPQLYRLQEQLLFTF